MTNHRPALSLSRTLALACVFGSAALLSATTGGREVAVANSPAPARVLVLDPAVFGSSSNQAAIKSAPATWSSRAEVRQAARWGTSGKYLV